MSEKSNIMSLFDRSGNLTLQTMQRYLEGTLSAEEKAVVDQHLQDSPFDREALEGMKQDNAYTVTSDVEDLNAAILEMSKNRVPVKITRSSKGYYWIAAAGLLSVVTLTALLFFMFRNTSRSPELAVARPDTMMAEKAEDLSPVIDTIVRMEEKKFGGMAMAPKKEARGQGTLEQTDDQPASTPASSPVTIMEYEVYADDAVDLNAGVNGGSRVPVINGPAGAGNTSMSRNASNTIDADQAMEAQMMKMGEEESEADQAVFAAVENMPEFPGGQNALYKYLSQNIIYPDSAKNNGIQGRVFVTFVVEKDGTIDSVSVLKGIGGGCDEEAMRVVREMPNWIPATQRGKPIRVRFNLPIKFVL